MPRVKFYFTENGKPTHKEVKAAKKVGATLVNGLYGNSFNKPNITHVYGKYPEHLKEFAGNEAKPRAEAKPKSPEIIAPTE